MFSDPRFRHPKPPSPLQTPLHLPSAHLSIPFTPLRALFNLELCYSCFQLHSKPYSTFLTIAQSTNPFTICKRKAVCAFPLFYLVNFYQGTRSSTFLKSLVNPYHCQCEDP